MDKKQYVAPVMEQYAISFESCIATSGIHYHLDKGNDYGFEDATE